MDSSESIAGSIIKNDTECTNYQSNCKGDIVHKSSPVFHNQGQETETESKKYMDMNDTFIDAKNEKTNCISVSHKQTLPERTTSTACISTFGNSDHHTHTCSCESVECNDLPPGLDISYLEKIMDGDTPLLGDQNYSKSCEDVYIFPFRKNSLVVGPPPSRSLSEELLTDYTVKQKQRHYVQLRKGKLVFPSVFSGERRIRSSCKPFLSRAIAKKDLKPKVPIQPPLPSEEKKSRFTTEQKLVILCLCLVDITSFLSMSIIAPFFPKEAAQKGMREAVSGFVFSIYALVVMLFSPIFGKLIPIIGTHFLFLGGVFFSGGCNILFGFLNLIPDYLTFAVFCFVVRAFEAVGAAAYCTASCTIIIDTFPDDIGTVFGFTETCIGIGMSLGPAIGGFLYSMYFVKRNHEYLTLSSCLCHMY